MFYPFIDFNTGLIHRRRSTSSDVHVKKKDMVKGEDTEKTEEKGEDTEKTEEKGEESQETEVARLKQTIRRTERNRLKLKAGNVKFRVCMCVRMLYVYTSCVRRQSSGIF